MPNEEVLAKIGMKRQQINTIKKMQWGFIAHEFRRERGDRKKIIEAEMAGKRARRRQKLKTLDWMMTKLGVREEKQLGEDEIKEDGMRKHHHDPSTAFNAMTQEEDPWCKGC